MDGLRLIVHPLNDGDGLQTVALLTQNAAALLLAFLYGDAYAGHFAACLMHQVDECMCGLAVS